MDSLLSIRSFSYAVDMYFSGLNVEVDRILEIACVITDGNLTKSVEVIFISDRKLFLVPLYLLLSHSVVVHV